MKNQSVKKMRLALACIAGIMTGSLLLSGCGEGNEKQEEEVSRKIEVEEAEETEEGFEERPEAVLEENVETLNSELQESAEEVEADGEFPKIPFEALVGLKTNGKEEVL